MKKNKANLSNTKNERFWQTVPAAILIMSLFSGFFYALGPVQQDDGIEFEQISIKQGLSQGSANCILQDNLGFIWIGNQSGLNRYDGKEFKSFTNNAANSNSISNNLVISLFKEKSGILWIGTYNGLNRFDPTTEKFSNHISDPGEFEEFKNKSIWAIASDKDGRLWIGTDDGLYVQNMALKKFIKYKNESGKTIEKVKTIFRDRNKTLWVGAMDGLHEITHDKDKTTIDIQYQLIPNDLYLNETDAMIEGDSGILWIGTVGGLYMFDREKKTFAITAECSKIKQITVIFEDKNHILWIGTRSDGLYRFDLQTRVLQNYKNDPTKLTSLSNNNVAAIFQDKTDLMWVGTVGGGINRFYQVRLPFDLFKNIPGYIESLSNNDIRGICEDKDGMIWIGTNGRGITKFDPRYRTFTHYLIGDKASKNPRRNYVQTIFIDKNGIIWVGTNRSGLYKFNPKDGTFEQFTNQYIVKDDHILEIYEDKAQRLWIGILHKGLIVLDKDRHKAVNYKNDPGNPSSISDNNVYSIFRDESNCLWIGTSAGGLNKLDLNQFAFDPKKDRFTRFQPDKNNKKSISDSFISAIYRDTKGRLWVGTGGTGLNLLKDEKTKQFKTYSTQDGLPDNVIYDILEDLKGNIWVSTNRGLSKFNPQTAQFRNYTINDGLQGPEYNRRSACKSHEGLMYFGGFNGFNEFDPGKVQDTFTPPPVVITSFKKLNKNVPLPTSISETKMLNLSYKDSFISFGFAALSFLEPENNQYAYKLEPINKEWVYLGNRHDIDFTSLRPGRYTLRVKAANNHGVWNEKGTSIIIGVSTPYWSTWWFIVLLIVVGTVSIIGLVRFRTKKMEERNKKLEDLVTKRTDEITRQKEELRKTNRQLTEEIEERTNTEKKLKDSEELYRTLVETSPDAITLSDIQDGKIIMANPQFAALCGYTNVDEMRTHARNIFGLMDEKSRELAHKNIEKIKNHGENRNTEYILISKGGTSIPVECSSALVEIPGETPQYFLSIIRDIRNRKKAEQQEKIQQEKLIQMDKMISLGRLVSGVAHELNNPASSIKMNSEIFDRVWKNVSPVLEEYYKTHGDFSLAGIPYMEAKPRLEELIVGFMESASRIEKIIKDLKGYSRPGDPSTREPIQINSIIQSAISLTHNLIKKTTPNFTLELADDLPVLQGNPQTLEQIFINLIQNACHALLDSNKNLSISTAYNSEKNQVVVKVKDEGVGISKDQLKYITDPFFTTKRDQGGTGLGLWISLLIIEDHKGTIHFDSTVGVGTTVTVCLPVNH